MDSASVLPVVGVCQLLDCSISVHLTAELNQGMLLPADSYISTRNGLGYGPRTAVGLANAHHLHLTSHTELLCQAVCVTIHVSTSSQLLLAHFSQSTNAQRDKCRHCLKDTTTGVLDAALASQRPMSIGSTSSTEGTQADTRGQAPIVACCGRFSTMTVRIRTSA